MEKISPIKERILQFIKNQNIRKVDFCEITGISYANMKGKSLYSEIGGDKIAEILSKYPILNPEWLLTGEGEMLRKEAKSYNIDSDENIQALFDAKENYDNLQKDQEINLYDINAAANLQTLFELGQQNVIGKLRIPNLPRCDGAIYLRGDSMYPLLKSGDIVIYKILNNMSNITFGEMYLIDYSIDGDDYLVVKYVNESDIDNHIRLVSYNQHFGPMDIPLSSVRSIAIVKASVRINTLL
jgi:phage repressor protein C with HTH and peptisase S24 domain